MYRLTIGAGAADGKRFPSRAFLAGAAVSTFAILHPVLAAAQTDAPEVVVSAPAPVSVYEQPASQTLTTIDRDQFKDQPAFSAGEILQQSPGVTFRQGNGPRDVGISIRGSNARNGFGIKNIRVYEDGFPVTQPDGLSRTDITDPHAYAGVDVYRGPSSAMFGNYATGGAINFRTRTGGDIRGFELGSDFGSFGYYNGYATAGDKGDNWDISAFASGVRGDGFITNSTFDTETEDILASYSPTSSDTFTLKIINNNLDTGLPLRQTLSQFRQNPFQKGCEVPGGALGCPTVALLPNGISGTRVARSATQADLGRDDRRTIAGLRWEHAIDDRTMFRLQGVFDDKNIDQPTGATAAVGDTPTGSMLADVTQHGGLFGLDAVHYGGVFYEYENIDNSTFNVAADGSRGARTALSSGYQYNLGARGREEVSLTKNLTGILGLGFEYSKIDATSTSFSATTGAVTSVVSAERDFYNVAPEGGLQYRLNDEWLLRGRVSTGYGIPQSSNLFVTSAGVAGNNTQLEPQTNVGIDIGADWTPSPGLQLSLTGFYEFFENEFVTQSPGVGLQNFTFNVPASEHRGIEATLDWRFAPGWRAFLSYTLNDQYYTDFNERVTTGGVSRVLDRRGNKIPGVEPHFLFARLGYDQPDGLFAGLGAFVDFSWRDEFFADNGNQLKIPGYELVNLTLHYDSSVADSYLKGVTFYFTVQNLFDKTYVASANNVTNTLITAGALAGTETPGSTLASTAASVYAGSPRAFVGGVKVRF
jgi:iron complex outermembrane receptor protein